MSTHGFILTPFGTRAVLVATADVAQAQALAAHLRTALTTQVASIVPGSASVVVTGRADDMDVSALVQSVLPSVALTGATTNRTVTVPVHYTGEDLSSVADLLGLSTDEVVARHTAPTYTVDFLGFAPGFPYLSGLDPLLSRVGRLDTPRTRIPAGSVGLAAGRTCVYPNPSPGGWRLLGHTETVMFDPADTSRPSLLVPGDCVRFEATR